MMHKHKKIKKKKTNNRAGQTKRNIHENKIYKYIFDKL